MTERRGDPGFSVTPQRLGDDPRGHGPRRARWFGVAIVVAAAAAILAIAFLGPRLSGRPNLDLSFFATPTPGVTPSPTPTATATPTADLRATPLPEVTPVDGGTAIGRVAIGVDGVRILDLANGTIEKATDGFAGRDAVLRDRGGAGWTCVCFVDETVDGQPVRIVRVIGIDAAGRQTGATDVLQLPATFPEAGQGEPVTDVDIGPGGSMGLLAVGRKAGAAWTFAVAALDVEGRRLGPMTDIGALELPATPDPSGSATEPSASPSPSPSPDVYIDGPHVRIAPGDRVAFVWAVVQAATETGRPRTTVRTWRVELGKDGAVGQVRDVTGFDDLPLFCPYVGFAARDRVAWLCQTQPEDPSTGPPGPWQIGTIDLDGQPVGSVEISTRGDTFFGEPLFDRANGQMYVWDPFGLELIRIDVHSLETASVRLDPAASAGPGVVPRGGAAQPDWRDADSAVQLFSYSPLSAAPDGSRLYLLGFGRPTNEVDLGPPSLGILVVDRTTLALVDRWAAAAEYVGVAVMPDGQVLASGASGMDAQGREAPWQGSLTVHDPTDGRILVRYGRLGQDGPPLALDP